jgi:hypothetical protein
MTVHYHGGIKPRRVDIIHNYAKPKWVSRDYQSPVDSIALRSWFWALSLATSCLRRSAYRFLASRASTRLGKL